MTSEPSVPMVWLGAALPDADQSRALSGWAHRRGIELVLPADARPRGMDLDARASRDTPDEVERLLERVRDAMAARDGDAADRSLAAAESVLRAHPELPQASWLMAELERARSSRFRRLQPLDEEAAERSWMRAEALDGGRDSGVGEEEATAHPADATLVLEPLPAPARLRLDGQLQPVGAAVVATHAGPHALVVTWDDTLVWAGWIDAPAGSSAWSRTLPAPPPCSIGDLGTAHPAAGAAGAVDAASVRCASWVAALPGPRPTSVLVAVCAGVHCGAPVESTAPRPAAWTWTAARARTATRWPSWATWGLVGAGAVIATGVVVIASGVLQAGPSEVRFVSGGVKAQ